jgi:hypothetical protein
MAGKVTAMPGYLPCDGSEQLIATYQQLYNVITTTYGSATAGYFKLPLLNSSDNSPRMLRGAVSNGNLAAQGGAMTHSHNVTNAVSSTALGGGGHSHNVPAQTLYASGDHGHSYNAGTSGNSSSLQNDARSSYTTTAYNNAAQHTHGWNAGNTDNTGWNHTHDANLGTVNTSGAHSHKLTVTQSNHSVSGSNDPPYHLVRYYIRYA